MQYQKIENALTICSQHIGKLDVEDINNKELETYLVSGLVLLIVSEYEVYLESLFGLRADKSGDVHAANYIKKGLAQCFRSPDLKKINETLRRFDESYRNNFFQDIENSIEHAAWDSLLKARHAVVHQQGSLNLTFRELTEKFELTKSVISKLEEVLNPT